MAIRLKCSVVSLSVFVGLWDLHCVPVCLCVCVHTATLRLMLKYMTQQEVHECWGISILFWSPLNIDKTEFVPMPTQIFMTLKGIIFHEIPKESCQSHHIVPSQRMCCSFNRVIQGYTITTYSMECGNVIVTPGYPVRLDLIVGRY